MIADIVVLFQTFPVCGQFAFCGNHFLGNALFPIFNKTFPIGFGALFLLRKHGNAVRQVLDGHFHFHALHLDLTDFQERGCQILFIQSGINLFDLPDFCQAFPLFGKVFRAVLGGRFDLQDGFLIVTQIFLIVTGKKCLKKKRLSIKQII